MLRIKTSSIFESLFGLSRGRRNNKIIGFCQRALCISFRKWNLKHFEKIGVGGSNEVFFKSFLFVTGILGCHQDIVVGWCKTRYLFDFRNVRSNHLAIRVGNDGVIGGVIRIFSLQRDLINSIST